jgi:ribosomal-protein-alanine N-acetyltransferase
MHLIEKLTVLVENACKSDMNPFGFSIWSHHVKPMIPITRDLATKQNADIEIVTIATLLHDYASILNPDFKKDHHLHGARIAEEILLQEAYPVEKIELIKSCIRNHRGSVNNPKESLEEICVADADAIVHIQQIPSLFYAAFVQFHIDIDEGTNWVTRKLERDWNKLSDFGKKYIEEQYHVVMFALNKEKMQTFDFIGQVPIDLTSLQIEGDRILLRSIEERDSSEIFKEFTPEITRYMFPKPAEKIEETLSFIAESLDGMRGGWDLVLAITKKENGEFLGCCGFYGKGNPRRPALGIWIKKEAHGKKYGREAIKTLTSWAVEHIDFEYAIYPVDKANIASRKIPESLGGTIFEEKKVRTMNGSYLDEVVYKIPYDILKHNNTMCCV